MPTQKPILAALLFALAMFGSSLAADKPATQTDVDKLQEQVRTIDKELAVQREAFVRKLDDVEKRQNEITAQQANSLAAISNQTTTVGNYISNTSILITVLVLLAGFITYFSATTKAEKEARDASAKWFKENSVELTRQIEALRSEATKQIRTQVDQVSSSAAVAHQSIAASAAGAILNASKMSPSGEISFAADSRSVEAVTEASQSLKSKPETQFTADDFFTRGLSYFSNQDFHAALSAFESAIQLADTNSIPNQTPAYLFAKAVTLGKLDRSVEAIAVYDELDRRFGADTAPAVREQVGKGLFNKGVTLGQMDKSVEAIAVYDELDRRFGADTTPAVREQVASGLVNKGFRLGQMDKSVEEIAVYDELDRRFGADTTPAVREKVANGLNGAGFNRILLAKQDWANGAKKLAYLASANAGLKRAASQCVEDKRAMVLGNLGYSLFLAGQIEAAEAPTLECLRLGGQVMLNAQRADANLHRVEPEDSQYEELLARLWDSLPPTAAKG